MTRKTRSEPTIDEIKVAQDLLFGPDLAPKPGSIEWWIKSNPREVAAFKRQHERSMVRALLDYQAKNEH